MGGLCAAECGQMSVDDVVALLHAANVECGSTVDPDSGEVIIVCCQGGATLDLMFSAADEKLPTCLFYTSAKGGERRDRNELFWTVFRTLEQAKPTDTSTT